MKRYILAISLLLISGGLFAYCIFNNPAANATIPAVTGLSSTPANVTVRMWRPGSADWATNGTAGVGGGVCTAGGTTGGCDSDGMGGALVFPGDCATFDGSAMLWMDDVCGFGPANAYWVLTDWSWANFDGCPNAGDRFALLAWDTAGNYTLQTTTNSGAWDNIGTQVAAPLSAATATAIAQNGANVNVTWAALPAAVTYGAYAAGDAPASALVTTFNVYTYQGAAAPTNFAVGAWTLNTSAVSTGTAVSTIAYTAPPLGQGLWLSRQIVIDGIALPFVSSTPATLYNPSGAPVITAMSAINSGLTTTVNWTSADESRVTGYQVFWAPVGGEFTAVGSRVNPAGNNYNYSEQVRIPSTTTFSVKVGAYLTDGTVEYSSATNVKVSNIIKDKTRVNVN